MAFRPGLRLPQPGGAAVNQPQPQSTLGACRPGALNLLQNCAQLQARERLLVVCERPALGWYDAEAPRAVIKVARELGAKVSVRQLRHAGDAPAPALEPLRAAHDCTIFFARAGDRQRFSCAPPGQRSVMCYARDAAMLASRYATTHHAAMSAMKRAVDDTIRGARAIAIRCPLGTDFTGTRTAPGAEDPGDVGILRFPQGVHAPVSARHFRGQIALSNYVTSTGSACYQPDHLHLQAVVMARVAGGTIRAFTGHKTDVKRLRAHYRRVSGLLGVDPETVHSWHAGIHPGCCYPAPVHEHPDRWGNNVFTHPRILHFHTCGDNPGEIAWNIENPTVTLDGRPLWERGRLRVEDFAPTRRVLAQWPELRTLYRVGAPACQNPRPAQ